MDKESIFDLQKIDCNCNDCKYLVRDFRTEDDTVKAVFDIWFRSGLLP